MLRKSHSVYLETFGCQMNVSDSEQVATVLESKGYTMSASEESADIVLLNTCSIREKAEHKLYTRIGQIRKQSSDKIIGVMGCVAQLEGETLLSMENEVNFVLGTKAIGRIDSLIKTSLDGSQAIDLNERENDYDWTINSSQRHSKYVAFVPIIEGCNKFCTYCIVPFSRGREKSLAPEIIVNQVKRLREQGFKEVHLIGQNVNSYRPRTDVGFEEFRGATPFSRLLRAVAATGIERIKFNTSFPRDFHEDIVDAINENGNLCNWVHLPFQSGSNSVLKAMRRGHSIENYFKKIDTIKASPRNISLSTDVIVGFPGETRDDFEATVRAFDYCQFDSAYIFKYSPRDGTPAFFMKNDVSEDEKTSRFLELEARHRESQIRLFDECIGRVFDVLGERFSAKNTATGLTEISGHSTCHRVVNFAGSENLLGQICKVRVTERKRNSLFGVLV